MVLFGGIMRRREERRVKEAESRGRSEGMAQMREKWREWNRRRLEAEVAGRPFTEPAPSDLPSECKTDT